MFVCDKKLKFNLDKRIQSLQKMWTKLFNWLYVQLHYFLNFSQLLVSCLPLLDKLINPGVSDYCCSDY